MEVVMLVPSAHACRSILFSSAQIFVAACLVLAATAVSAQPIPPPGLVIGSGNTATADPPVARPETTPCVVTLFNNFAFADFSPKPFSFTPACPGPWAKVVLNADFSIQAGRQFDRTAEIWIGGVNVYFGTTSEPSGKVARSWHITRKKSSPVRQTISDKRHLTLRLDVSRSQDEIVNDFLRAVQFHRDRNRHFFATLKKQQKSRRRLDQYDVYLKVWDMRKSGLSFPEIAKRVYSREYSLHPPRKNPIGQRVT